MKTYPIALELTVWFDLGLNQYEVVIDEASKLSIKRTDDVLHTRELTSSEVAILLDAIAVIKVPITEELDANPNNKASSSYELIIESAHFSLESLSIGNITSCPSLISACLLFIKNCV